MRDIIPTPSPAMAAYKRLYRVDDSILTIQSVEECIEDMNKYGITKACIRGMDSSDTKMLGELQKKYEGVLYGFVGVNVKKDGIKKAFKDLEYGYKEYNLYGMAITPFTTGVYMDDRRNYPFFALSEQMNKVMVTHAALHFNPTLPADLGDPIRLDPIAIDFPDLKMVMGHAGHGFDLSMLGLVQRHKNLYIDYSALHPQFMRPEVVFAANFFLRKKALFGTSFPLVTYDNVKEWKQAISESNHDLFFHGNLEKILGLVDEKPKKKEEASPKEDTSKKKK